jgi:class 3 adenylate cyclase/tetratricopeptide (TPR) repeat protein
MPNSAGKQCAQCGFPNEALVDHCVSCGEPLQVHCPQCYAPVRSTQNYCGDCGRLLTALPEGSSQTQTPQHLLKRVWGSEEGERKIATLLFADIASSTALIENLDAEDARRILKPTVDTMIDIVHRYEGITREQGDGILASFGAPIALEDHAARACYAALDMQDALRTQAAGIRRELGMLFEVRIGINSGPVIITVKHQGEEFIDFRIDGVATHIARRAESLARPGTILVTRDTLALADGFFQVRTIGPVPLRGIANEVILCELEGVNTRTRIRAAATRGLSKFVGREDEIESLRRAATLAKEGHGQAVALIGDAGVGKSRIFLEFVRSLGAQGWLVLDGGSVSYGKPTSYFALVDLLSRYFEIQGRDTEQQIRERVTTKLLALGDEKLLAQLPLFAGALRIGVSDEAWTNLTPSERQSLLFDAIKRLLLREAQNGPLCLVFEDLHWIDTETQTFLEMLLENLPAARILLLVNYRAQYQTSWTEKNYILQMRIDPLSAATADELLDGLLGSTAELVPIKKRLREATQGNPLFLEESVRSLIESGVLNRASDHHRSVALLPADFVPRTIEALLAARIDRLRPELKELLQCASVIGNDIKEPLFVAVTGLTQPEFRRAVRELQLAEFLYERTLFPETEYAFKHSMTRDVAYASMLRERRMMLHARAVRSLESLAAGRLEEHVERLADHAERGALWDKALEYLQRSGVKAYSLYANADAARFFERALTVLKRLPETPNSLRQAADIRFELRNALLPLGETDRILQCLDELDPILTSLGDKQRSARYAAFRCNHHFLIGEQRRAREFGETAVRLARECGDRDMLGESLYRLAQSYYALGEYRQAIVLLEQSLEFTANELRRDRHDLSIIPSVMNRTWLVIALAECGRFAAGMNHAKRALEVAEGAEHPLSEVLGWLSIGHVLLRKGEIEGAVSALERGLDLCDRWSFRVWRPRLASALGVAYARSGRAEEGLQLASEAIRDAEQMHLIADKPRILVSLGRVLMFARQIDAALAVGKQAVEIAVSQEAKGDEAWARFLIGQACLASEPKDLDKSEMHLDIALGLAAACGARPLTAVCDMTLCRIHACRGDHLRAKEFDAAGTAIYQELGMQPIPLVPAR